MMRTLVPALVLAITVPVVAFAQPSDPAGTDTSGNTRPAVHAAADRRDALPHVLLDEVERVRAGRVGLTVRDALGRIVDRELVRGRIRTRSDEGEECDEKVTVDHGASQNTRSSTSVHGSLVIEVARRVASATVPVHGVDYAAAIRDGVLRPRSAA